MSIVIRKRQSRGDQRYSLSNGKRFSFLVVGIQEARNRGRPAGKVEGVGVFPDLAIGLRGALLLPKIFAPGFDDEGFHVTTVLGDIAEKPPIHGSVAPA